MILEGVVTTRGPDGSTNIAPMGPSMTGEWRQFELRPFKSSVTYHNLCHHREGVLHVTDDVELIARASIGLFDGPPELIPARRVEGCVLADACRWYEFHVDEIDDSGERSAMLCRVLHQSRKRDFFGFNRAKHAVIEAAILATRTAFRPIEEIASEFDRLRPLVEKTGGDQERRAFRLLESRIRAQPGDPS